MQPTIIKHRKTYRELFLLRYHKMQRPQSLPSGLKKPLPPSILKTKSRPLPPTNYNDEVESESKTVEETSEHNQCPLIGKSCKSSAYPESGCCDFEIQEYEVESAQRDAKCQLTPRDKNKLSKNVNIRATSPNGYGQMISEYAKALDLSDFERESLGFYENEHDTDTVSPNNFQDSTVDNIRKVKTFYTKNTIVDQIDEQQEQSIWTSIVEQLPIMDFLPFVTVKSNKSSNDGDSCKLEEEVGENQDPEDLEEITEDEQNVDQSNDPCGELITVGILNSIEKICDGDHGGCTGNCFKCQYKDTFKSFTMKYLDELEYIWNSKELSPSQHNEAINETLAMWVYQLSEQNISLAEAYNESFQESEKLKSVLLESRNSMRTTQKELDKDKACIDALNYELSLRDKEIKKLKYAQDMEVEKIGAVEYKLQEARADVESLTELVIRLRDKGVWDINGLPMGDATFNKIFNGNYYLHGAKVIGHKEYSSKKREWRNEIDHLKSEKETLQAIIAAKDKEIQRFRSSRSADSAEARCKTVE